MRTKKPLPKGEDRYPGLKKMLEDRQREILEEVHGRIRDQREADVWGKMHEVLDEVESSDADIQEDMEFAFIQMKAETLTKINDALARVAASTYGNCSDCGEEILEQRLRALPFAVRCKECEEASEIAKDNEKALSQRRNSPIFFFSAHR